jgi:hypothetical protein
MNTENQTIGQSENTQSVNLGDRRGRFAQTLVRNNAEIRQDRALSIIERAQLLYRRTIEDMRIERTQLQRDRANMLDLSPSDANSLKLASDFNAEGFVRKDIELGVKLRQLGIKLEVAEASYTELFGETI